MIRHIFLLLFILIATPLRAAEFDHGDWANLLEHHVVITAGGVSSKVDYSGFQHDHDALTKYLNRLSLVERAKFDAWSSADQLAFLINAYNAWTVELILTGYPDIGSIKDLGSLTKSPWQKSFIPLLGEKISLDDIEHGLIRGSGRYNDPRIHFAVNCASIGCPALSKDAFLGATLDMQLDDAVRAFLGDVSRNRLEDGGLVISPIFSWYGGDFEQGWRDIESLEEFLALYASSLSLSEMEVEMLLDGEMPIHFLDYDWRLNDSNGPSGGKYSQMISPIWLMRSNPVWALISGGMLLLIFGFGIWAFRRRRRSNM